MITALKQFVNHFVAFNNKLPVHFSVFIDIKAFDVADGVLREHKKT